MAFLNSEDESVPIWFDKTIDLWQVDVGLNASSNDYTQH